MPLLIGFLEDVLFDRMFANHSVDMDFSRLSDTMATILGLWSRDIEVDRYGGKGGISWKLGGYKYIYI